MLFILPYLRQPHEQSKSELIYSRKYSIPSHLVCNVRALEVPRPVYQERLPGDIAERDETPEPAVLTVVPVIAHNEYVPFGHHAYRNEAPLVGRVPAFSVNHRVLVAEKVFSILVELLPVPLVHISTRKFDGHLLSVYYELPAVELYPVPGYAHDPLDVINIILRRIVLGVGVSEDYYVPPLDLFDREDDLVRKGDLSAVNEFAYEQVVPDEESGYHRPRGYLEGLEHERPDEERKCYRKNERLDILSQLRFRKPGQVVSRSPFEVTRPPDYFFRIAPGQGHLRPRYLFIYYGSGFRVYLCAILT